MGDFEQEREDFIRASQSAGPTEDRYIIPRPHPAARSYRRGPKRPRNLSRELIAGALFLAVLFGIFGIAVLIAQR